MSEVPLYMYSTTLPPPGGPSWHPCLPPSREEVQVAPARNKLSRWRLYLPCGRSSRLCHIALVHSRDSCPGCRQAGGVRGS